MDLLIQIVTPNFIKFPNKTLFPLGIKPQQINL